MQKKIADTQFVYWRNRMRQAKFVSVGVFFLAFVLRLPLLGSSFWLDEAAQALESVRPLHEQFAIAHDFQPPLFHIIVHFLSIFSHSESWLRMSSLIAGLIMIAATYRIGKLLWGRQVGLIACLLLAFNSFHIFYSQELRPYAFAGMFACLSWLVILKNRKEQRVLNLIQAGKLTLLSIAGVFTTYLYPFCLAGQLLYIVTNRSRQSLKEALFIGTLTTLAFLPWIPSLQLQLKVSQELRLRTPSWEHVVSTPQLKALPLVFGKFLFGVLNLEVNIIYLLPIAIISILSLYLLFQKRHDLHSIHPMFLFCWLIFPIIAAWGVSFMIPVLQAKRVLFSLPAFELFFAVLISTKTKTPMKYLKTVLAAVLFTIHITGTVLYFANPNLQRENWKAVIAQIDQSYSPSDSIIVFRFDHVFSPWDWYTHKTFKSIVTGTGTKTSLAQIDPAMKPALDYDQVIVFDYLRDLTDPNHFVDQWLESYDYHQTQLIDARVLGFVRVYTKGGMFADNTISHN